MFSISEHETDEELDNFQYHTDADNNEADDVVMGECKIEHYADDSQQHEQGVQNIADFFSVFHLFVGFGYIATESLHLESDIE